jgi:hypothetical protein
MAGTETQAQAAPDMPVIVTQAPIKKKRKQPPHRCSPAAVGIWEVTMRKVVEPKVPSDLYAEALLEFLVDAANQYAEAQWWRMPSIAAHFEQYAIDGNDAEVIETAEFLAWRCARQRVDRCTARRGPTRPRADVAELHQRD